LLYLHIVRHVLPFQYDYLAYQLAAQLGRNDTNQLPKVLVGHMSVVVVERG
jgi:hypothetical protein